jgi:hypothetical protein
VDGLDDDEAKWPAHEISSRLAARVASAWNYPILGLAGEVPGPGWLFEANLFEGNVDSVTVAYGSPIADAPNLVLVRTSRHLHEPSGLDRLLKFESRRAGQWSLGSALTRDSQPSPGPTLSITVLKKAIQVGSRVLGLHIGAEVILEEFGLNLILISRRWSLEHAIVAPVQDISVLLANRERALRKGLPNFHA